MTLNPFTLLPESEEETQERQARTGVLGTGASVWCRPVQYDPTVVQVQHRAVCVTRPYSACTTCLHSTFTLVFKAQPLDPYQVLACPRWRDDTERTKGNAPDTYAPIERALCFDRPFPFCPSCPSSDVLEDIGADKVSPGWYGRWRRFTRGDEEEDDDS